MTATSQDRLSDALQADEVIFRIQRGEIEQFAVIVNTFQQRIYRYCCRLLGNREDAEDAVQDIMVKAYQSLHRYKPVVSFSAWLYRIACNHCLNLLRRRRLQARLLRIINPGAAAASPEQELEDCLYSYPLAMALARLTAEERNILVLRVFEQQTFAEMGEILKISPNALHKRMERIKLKMRNAMTTKEEISCSNPESAMSSKI